MDTLETIDVNDSEKEDGSLWFLLSSTKKTYLCCKGPFDSPEERDQAIINEVKKRDRN